ncbi:MAG: hypothetical protein JNN15_11190 [Blastocatellia bacterium]|nr:hypothetical protein [Blastocatellia bacterium]
MQINKTLTLILFLLSSSVVLAQSKPTKLTNDDFSSPTPSVTSNNSKSTNVVADDLGLRQVQGFDLRFRLSDLKIAAAKEPDNRYIQEEIGRVETAIRQSSPQTVTRGQMAELEYMERYVALKIELILAERASEAATTNIQAERRKVLPGNGIIGGDSNTGTQLVKEAEKQAQEANAKVEGLRAKLQEFVENGRRSGIAPRVFR